MEIKDYLTKQEYFLYNEFKTREHLRYKIKKAKIILEYYYGEYALYTDKAIGKKVRVSKQAMNQKRTKLYNKLKRLGVN